MVIRGRRLLGVRGRRRNMKNLSDEELVRLALTQAKLIPYWMEDDTRNEDELISRLARGRKGD